MIPATEAAVAQPIALPNSNVETLTLSEKSIQTLALYLLIAYIIGVGFVLSAIHYQSLVVFGCVKRSNRLRIAICCE